MFQIALDYDKGVDIHLHETSPAGVAAVNYMVETVEKTPELKGKLTISHAFALATLNEQQVDEIATRMAAQQVTIASTVPIGTLHMPLKQLRDKGVFVMTGTDSVIDHWSPYGLGDMLEKESLRAALHSPERADALPRARYRHRRRAAAERQRRARVAESAGRRQLCAGGCLLLRRSRGAHFTAYRDVP
jgi:cytosine/adenosine deaminase-related metal-dependent hydrolase